MSRISTQENSIGLKKNISFHTFGCRLNYAETVSLRRDFERQGYQVLPSGTTTDIVVVNTCTVTQNGDTDTRRFVHRVCRNNPDVQIALIGCQAEIQKSSLKTLPNVRWIIGNENKMNLAHILTEHPAGNNLSHTYISTPLIRRKSFKIPTAAVDTERTRAHLKIQDGCDAFCSFCVIPYARGRARSREYDDIHAEAHTLAGAGHKEIVLTGINIGTYDYQGKKFCDVLAMLTRHQIDRIRISSIEPTTVSASLIDLMCQSRKICRYLHIPLQSASDKVLTLMHRKYTTNECDDFFNTALERVEGICLGTDIIVGFPGETDKEFDKTYQYLNDAPFAYFHIFSYSERTMAKSASFAGPLSTQTIKARSRHLRDLGRRKRLVFMRKHEERIETVLFETFKNGFWQGLTDNYIRVLAKSEKDIHNRLLPVRLLSSAGDKMYGELL